MNEEIKFPENKPNKMLFGVWCGDFPKNIMRYPDGWQRLAKEGWNVILYTPNKLVDSASNIPGWLKLEQVPVKYYFEFPDLTELVIKRPERYSDLLRLAILRDQGGIYSDINDTDIKVNSEQLLGFLSRFDKSKNLAFISKDGERNDRFSNSTIISLKPNNKFIVRWLEEFKKLSSQDLDNDMAMILLMNKVNELEKDSHVALDAYLLQGRAWHDEPDYENPAALVVHRTQLTWAGEGSWLTWSRRVAPILKQVGVEHNKVMKFLDIMWRKYYDKNEEE